MSVGEGPVSDCEGKLDGIYGFSTAKIGFGTHFAEGQQFLNKLVRFSHVLSIKILPSVDGKRKLDGVRSRPGDAISLKVSRFTHVVYD